MVTPWWEDVYITTRKEKDDKMDRVKIKIALQQAIYDIFRNHKYLYKINYCGI